MIHISMVTKNDQLEIMSRMVEDVVKWMEGEQRGRNDSGEL